MELIRYFSRGFGHVEFMAWTLDVILEMVRSFILCESSVGSKSGGREVSSADFESLDAMV